MLFPLKYATAGQVIPLGPMLSSSDGDTEIVSGTIANTDIKIWKAGATSLADKNSGGATYMSSGMWYCTLDETDTDTYGPIAICIHKSDALYIVLRGVVMNVAAYNKLYSGTGFNDIAATSIVSGGAITTSGGLADVNVQKINDVTITGDGNGTPFGV